MQRRRTDQRAGRAGVYPGGVHGGVYAGMYTCFTPFTAVLRRLPPLFTVLRRFHSFLAPFPAVSALFLHRFCTVSALFYIFCNGTALFYIFCNGTALFYYFTAVTALFITLPPLPHCLLFYGGAWCGVLFMAEPGAVSLRRSLGAVSLRRSLGAVCFITAEPGAVCFITAEPGEVSLRRKPGAVAVLLISGAVTVLLISGAVTVFMFYRCFTVFYRLRTVLCLRFSACFRYAPLPHVLVKHQLRTVYALFYAC